MATKMSSGLKNKILGAGANGGSVQQLFEGGVMRIYSGAQPADADAIETGTLLLEVSLGSGTFEPCADATLTCSAITKANPGRVTTSAPHGLATGQKVTFSSMVGMTELEGVTATVTVIDADEFTIGIDTSGYGVFTSGTATEVMSANGLTWKDAVAGVLAKTDAEAWSGVGLVSGQTAGYARLYDKRRTTGASTSAVRLDLLCGTVGTEVIMSSLNVAQGVTSVVTAATIQFAA